MKKIFFILIILILSKSAMSQTFTEILGRPTNNSVTMSILFDQQAEVYWEYGGSSGNYNMNTATYTTALDSALEVDFINLNPNTKYYYRTRYRATGSTSAFLTGQEHSFHTARPSGSNFVFAIEADPHMDTNSKPEAYNLTLQNILAANPDFLIDLGDNFMSEKLAVQSQTEITNRHLLYRPYFGSVCHSVPLFIVLGNHEGEQGWRLTGTVDCLPVMATNTRKLFYPNPLPDSFYTSDTIQENFVGLREDYYAWEWGNVLIVILDPFWHTMTKSSWGWSLGIDQYEWFKKVLSTSNAKFKFVFCHNLLGGYGNDMRGGAEYADFFEMGGKNADSTWGFTQNRPGWYKPIHQLMLENNVNIFFHGHDHFFGKQDKDGMVYQEVPQPSNRNINNMNATQYGYVNGVFMPGRGFLKVSITDSTAMIDYVKTYLANESTGGHTNGEIAYSYTINATATTVNEYENQSKSIYLSQNQPNPFKSETTIKYRLFEANKVQLKLYDMFGREIKTLVNYFQQAGSYSVILNFDNLSLSNGIYYYTLNCGNLYKTMKMICIN